MDCPFCKIIAGEIPAEKIYEDEKTFAILDINPASKGHVLLLPKEHQFILQQLSPESFSALFLAAKTISPAIKKAVLAEKITWFIASGGAAGQQSPHVLMHLIARESNDGLDVLDAQGDVVKKDLPQKFFDLFPKNKQTPLTQKEHTAREQTAAQTNTQEHVDSKTTTKDALHTQEKLSALLTLLQEEPKLHELLVQDPKTFEMLAQKNPVLQEAFAGINLQELSRMLTTSHKMQHTKENIASDIQKVTQENKQDEFVDEKKAPDVKQAADHPDVPFATQLSDDELQEFLSQRPKLQALLYDDTLLEQIEINPRLAKFFTQTTPKEVAARLERRQKKTQSHNTLENDAKDESKDMVEHEDDAPLDFALLAKHLK